MTFKMCLKSRTHIKYVGYIYKCWTVCCYQPKISAKMLFSTFSRHFLFFFLVLSISMCQFCPFRSQNHLFFSCKKLYQTSNQKFKRLNHIDFRLENIEIYFLRLSLGALKLYSYWQGVVLGWFSTKIIVMALKCFQIFKIIPLKCSIEGNLGTLETYQFVVFSL